MLVLLSDSLKNHHESAVKGARIKESDKQRIKTQNNNQYPIQPSFTVVLRVMNNPTFDTIAQIHSICSRMSKAERLI